MTYRNKNAPKTTREWRQRVVRMLKIDAGEIDPPGTKYPSPPKPTTQAQRKRIVEALCAEMGMPQPDWTRRPRGRPEPIDVGPIKAAWVEIQRDRVRRYAEYGVTLQNHGRRASCRRCGQVLLDVEGGMVGVTPSALYVMHAQETGCR